MDNNESGNLVYAKISKRIGAYLIDYLVLLLIFLFELAIVNQLRRLNVIHITDYRLHNIEVGILAPIDCIFYYTIFESSKKQATIGKGKMGIIVTSISGERLSMGKAFLRTLTKYIGLVIGIVTSIKYAGIANFSGYILILLLPKRQALHDLIAGSVVINEKL